jgi:hypothetical protein
MRNAQLFILRSSGFIYNSKRELKSSVADLLNKAITESRDVSQASFVENVEGKRTGEILSS